MPNGCYLTLLIFGQLLGPFWVPKCEALDLPNRALDSSGAPWGQLGLHLGALDAPGALKSTPETLPDLKNPAPLQSEEALAPN